MSLVNTLGRRRYCWEPHLGIEVPTMPATTGPELIPQRTSIVNPLAVWKRDIQSITSRPNLATLATASFMVQGVGAPQITTAIKAIDYFHDQMTQKRGDMIKPKY